MRTNRLARGLAIIIFLIGFSPVVWAGGAAQCRELARRHPVQRAEKAPDGTYEITVAWNRFFQQHAPGTKYRNTRETSFWDQKCKGQTL